MSEQLKKIDIKEILNPRVTPELGFQSYEMLGGQAGVRDAQKKAFLSGEIANPILDYPKLDESQLNDGIKNLEKLLSVADSMDEPSRSVIWDSVAYRMAEMYWLKSVIRLNAAHDNGQLDESMALAQETQNLNIELYGSPNKEIETAILGEVLQQISSKELTEANKELFSQLTGGFSATTDEQSINVPGLELTSTEVLPNISETAINRLRDKIDVEFADIFSVADAYYESVVLQRIKEEQEFTHQDMYEIFWAAHSLRDPENMSGVRIIIDEDATALSWDSSRMAVIIGGKRAPIKTLSEMKAKLGHEYGVHGGRALSGINTELPVIGTGLYTDADEGESSDYLTFEEGLASLCEKAKHGSISKWSPLDIEKTLAISLANKGYDFRQVFETLWRVRVLLTAKSGEDLAPEAAEKAKSNAYMSCVRIFRGTPTAMPRVDSSGNPVVITFNKDLAYLAGKLKAMQFIDGATDAELDLAFRAKYDPTNHRQKAIVESVLANNIETIGAV